MKKNDKLYGLLDCDGRDTVCPHCGRPYEPNVVASKCPDCGGNIILQDAAITGLPYISSTLYFYNTPVTATITGYRFTEMDVFVEWMSSKPIYDNEDELTYGSFSIKFLNSIVFLNKDDVPKEKYELRKLYCDIETTLTEISSCKDLLRIEDDAIAEEDGEIFYSLNEAKAALENRFNEMSSEYRKDKSGDSNYVYEITYFEIVKVVEEFPEYDTYIQIGKIVTNIMKPVKAS